MSNTTTGLPRVWDLTSFFPAFDGPEYRSFKDGLRADLNRLLATALHLGPLGEASQPGWADVFAGSEDCTARLTHLSAYLECLNAAHATNEAYQAEEAARGLVEVQLTKLKTQLLRGLKGASPEALSALLAEPALAGASYAVKRLYDEAAYQMEPTEEALAADLGVDGFRAWGRLYNAVTGGMSFTLKRADGTSETVPMAQRNSLLSDRDRAVREATFTGSNAVWASAGDTFGAALNALAGTRHTLYARRGRGHFLDTPLHDAATSAKTLDAMFAAISENYEAPRRILRLGARLQGTPNLAWYDLNAPRPLDDTPVPPLSWDDAVGTVQRAFDAAYPALGKYFASMVERRWIESEKRPGKRAGGFLTGSPVIREERIYMTFAETVNDMVTLAHEAGHAWHSHVLGELRPCAREYPMTLAETASTFAEKILVGGLLSDPALTPARHAQLIDMETNHTPAYLLNIPVRFLFEKRFYEERKAGVVSVSRLCEIMVAAQREVYGDTLAAGQEDPWFWASKLHFYITDVSFYNFPYTFGFLLSAALYGEFRREGAAFLPRYEAFLKTTGNATCEDAVRSTLGWDLGEKAFWAGAIKAATAPADELEKIVMARGR